MIHHALDGQPLPVYSRGANVRDWLYVDDHAEGIWRILCQGQPGQTYDMGGACEMSNLSLLQRLLRILAEETGCEEQKYLSLVQFVSDRPGHDFRYAIDGAKIRRELGWAPQVNLDEGLRKTVRWYLSYRDWGIVQQ